MICLVAIRYNFQGHSELKWVDPDRYGYLDIVNDVYNTVLKDIPTGRTVKFKVKHVFNDDGGELEIESDTSVMTLLECCVDGKTIDLMVYNVQILEDNPMGTGHTINGYPNSVIFREHVRGRGNDNTAEDGGIQFVSTVESATDIGKNQDSVVRGTTILSGSSSATTSGTLRSAGASVTTTSVTNTTIGKQGRRDLLVSGKTIANTVIVVGTGETSKVAKSTSKSIASTVESGGTGAVDQGRGSDEDGYEFKGHDDSSDEEWNEGYNDKDCSTDDEIEENLRHSGDEDEERNGYSGDELSNYDEDEYHTKFTQVGGQVQGENMQLAVGQVFPNVTAFRATLQDYIIQEGIRILREKNESKRVTAICYVNGCPWRIHASKCDKAGTFMIKTFVNVHSSERVTKNRDANSRWIAKKLATELQADQEMKYNSTRAILNKKWGVQCGKMQLYRARQIAKEENEGSHAKSYSFLPEYGKLLLETNPGSVFEIHIQEMPNPTMNPIFKRMFICMNASKKGYLKGCRPFIGLDGCHLKGMYGGVLLAAIALDGNSRLFPVAFSVVESEYKNSWSFFLYYLNESLGPDATTIPLTFMSDRQKGLAEAIHEIFPSAHHRCCCRHLYNNYKVNHKGDALRAHFWRAASAHNEWLFNKSMSALQSVNKEAYNWLMQNPKCMWARHAFDHRAKSDHITNNMSESFNQWISSLRNKPILTLVDQIRTKLMSRLQQRYEEGCTYNGRVTPTVKRKLERISEDSINCRPIQTGLEEFEILDGFTRFVVNLRNWSCGCNLWRVTGIPCKHAASVIGYKRGNIENYCDAYFTVENYMQAHEEMIHPLPDLSFNVCGEVTGVLQPPPLRRLPGRSHKNRKREPDEAPAGTFRQKGGTIRCDNCKEMGHNKRTCQKAPVKVKKKRKQPTARHDEAGSSQIQTRSQSSGISSHSTAQAKKKTKMARRQERIKQKAAAALGQKD